MAMASVFISSVQKELQAERQAIKAFVEGDPLLRRYFTAFVFEDLPASDRRADDVYLDEVDRCAVYVGIFGQEINRRVGTRALGPEAPVTYELPGEAVGEAIVNAVAHRDYASNASVQVMLFSDRLEVWNPGELPPPLTVDKLRLPHASLPRNPLLADPLFLTRYVEKAGSGILDMISRCREAGLPAPEFRQDGGMFVQTLARDWLTEALMDQLGLNERQRKAAVFVRQNGRITNREHQELTGATVRTAARDLDGLAANEVFEKVGKAGRNVHYVLLKKLAADATGNDG